jgi:hypothetical protein
MKAAIARGKELFEQVHEEETGKPVVKDDEVLPELLKLREKNYFICVGK